MSDATSKIRIRGLKKAFGPKVVLDGVDLDVMGGTSFVVIGGSGTGKSVLLRCILGLITPDAGSIEIDGVDVTTLSTRQREPYLAKIGMLFQNGALFDSLSVWENVTFGLTAAARMGHGPRLTRAQAQARAAELLEQVGMDPAVGALSPSELSGGMQKRVGLARAIAARPEILFFDEPTTGLDPIMGAVIDGLIADCVRKLGSTAIAITHDMASAQRIGDRVGMLYKGRLIWQGQPSTLFDSGNPVVDQFTHGRREGPIKVDVRS
ncbi:ABC transporter ATP-binding protein [Komagataeibacter medellinensis]|uniref:ABC transporter ATP-binding protein n=1 Tax=Komagataeibacter medellinensis (strain NBRC 3288 / BCRC 11682 / LMG 1693 / Kondo 51) TaxID=634177 RepID=G2HZR6_KOMMN|nr:ATP-binding cassette domain-containing protein [Komagataeibacter medellinensis]BAK84174.1 ABC transporter ATP-binding protein [Komagataeibacter medellinensis NBRC 3288]